MNEPLTTQEKLAWASFISGVLLAFVALFIPPIGFIEMSVISVVSELLVLSGALVGLKLNFDARLKKFEARLEEKENKSI